MVVTIFETRNSPIPHFITVDAALERIRNGASKAKVEQVRATLDKEKAKSLKAGLPAIRFSGKFRSWDDESLMQHSGLIVLDWDDVYDVGVKMAQVIEKDYIYAAWLSPSGTGVKALARIADGKKHRDHFEALKEDWPSIGEDGKPVTDNAGRIKTELDRSGINESRICYESYDPHIHINKDAVPYTKIKIVEKIETKEVVEDHRQVFMLLVKWITNRGDAFVTGERNHFLFKLAAACCRFGLDEDVAVQLIVQQFKNPNGDCSMKGFTQPIKNAYKANRHRFGTAKFEKELLVDKVSRKEVDVQQEFEEVDGDRLHDVIYGIDMKQAGLRLFHYGYENIFGLNILELDMLWKPWRKELTLLTGHGNMGKSAFMKWYFVNRAVLYGEKFAVFAPEDKDNIYYHELTEILLGQDLTVHNTARTVTEGEYSNAYDFISAHFFYISPSKMAPTPDYIKSKFLELIIKEGVSWCVIDPFNQMTNNYALTGGARDLYLEVVLGDFKNFAKNNDIFFFIVAHPNKMQKDSTGNYPCPDVYDLSGGSMWLNKCDNILVYHRPFAQTDPNNPCCEFHSKKIKDQKVVGIKGFVEFELFRKQRRFYFSGRDYLGKEIADKKISFKPTVTQTSLLN